MVYLTSLSQISCSSFWTEMNIRKLQQLHCKEYGIIFDAVENHTFIWMISIPTVRYNTCTINKVCTLCLKCGLLLDNTEFQSHIYLGD